MDDNKLIRGAIVAGLIGLFSLGAYVAVKSFSSPEPVAVNNDPVDFSGPVKRDAKGKRLPASVPPSQGRPNAPGRGGYSDGGSSYDPPRIDARTDGSTATGSFFSPEGSEVVPLDSAGSSASNGGGGGSSGDSGSRSPSSTDSANTSTGGFFGGLGNLLGTSGTSSGTSSTGAGSSGTGTSGGGTGGGGTTTPTPAPPSPGTSAGTTGGGGSVVETANHFKASVSIGVPLSGVSGTTTGGGNYRYQVNLSGQQSQ